VALINDVGNNSWEEINMGTAGADYGWSVREGLCPLKDKKEACVGSAEFVDPVYAYAHETGCSSITGGAFVPASAAWPAEYHGAYLFADFVCGELNALLPNGDGGYVASEFASGLGGVADVAFGPDGALYYASLPRAASGGEVRRILYSPTG
jgi:glucose/arabinose dehydrogenase